MNTHPPRRTFDPGQTRRYGRPTMDHATLVQYSPKWGWSRLFNFPFVGSHWRPRMHTVVIAVDGGSSINDSSNSDTRGSYGVFVGKNSPRNTCGRLTDSMQTSSRAELEAVRQALLVVYEMDSEGAFQTFEFNEIIIKTDSTYVHDTFASLIWSYVNNGYRTKAGKPAKHVDLIREIHGRICRMEDSMGMAVRFWRVGREFNQEAHELANRALQHEGSDADSDDGGSDSDE